MIKSLTRRAVTRGVYNPVSLALMRAVVRMLAPYAGERKLRRIPRARAAFALALMLFAGVLSGCSASAEIAPITTPAPPPTAAPAPTPYVIVINQPAPVAAPESAGYVEKFAVGAGLLAIGIGLSSLSLALIMRKRAPGAPPMDAINYPPPYREDEPAMLEQAPPLKPGAYIVFPPGYGEMDKAYYIANRYRVSLNEARAFLKDGAAPRRLPPASDSRNDSGRR